MSPELNKPEDAPAAEADVTRRINRGAAEPDAGEPKEKRTAFSSLREAYVRARDGRRATRPEAQARTAKTVDRSKGLLILAGAVIIMIFVFLGMFSSSSGTKDRAANRTKPSLGRPDVTAGTAENRGSVAPLLNADTNGQETNSDQVSADDVKATGRLRVRPQPRSGDTLASIPPMDPALEAYRQAKSRQPCSEASARGRERPASGATASASS